MLPTEMARRCPGARTAPTLMVFSGVLPLSCQAPPHQALHHQGLGLVQEVIGLLVIMARTVEGEVAAVGVIGEAGGRGDGVTGPDGRGAAQDTT